MGKWIYCCDGSTRGGLYPRILCMGEIPFSRPIPPLEVLEGTDYHWVLSSILRHVHLLLVGLPSWP